MKAPRRSDPDLKTLRHGSTEAQGDRGARAQRDRNTGSEDAERQRCRDIEAQRYADAVTQKHRYRRCVARLLCNVFVMRILIHMIMHIRAPAQVSPQQSLPESGGTMLAKRQRGRDAILKSTVPRH